MIMVIGNDGRACLGFIRPTRDSAEWKAYGRDGHPLKGEFKSQADAAASVYAAVNQQSVS
jgi:hypothetical protein